MAARKKMKSRDPHRASASDDVDDPVVRAKWDASYAKFLDECAREDAANAPDDVAAFHGAGHAVAAVVLGARFRTVSIERKRTGAACLTASAGKGTLPKGYAAWAEVLAVVAWAGLEAEQIRYRQQRLGLRDDALASKQLEAVASDRVRALVRSVRRLLLANWVPLHAIALTLLAQRSMTAAEVRAVIEAVPRGARASKVRVTRG